MARRVPSLDRSKRGIGLDWISPALSRASETSARVELLSRMEEEEVLLESVLLEESVFVLSGESGI